MMAIASCLRAPCPRGRAVGARLLRPRVVASSPTRAGALRLHAGLRAVASSNGIRSRSAAKDIGAQWHWQAAAASCVAGSSSGGSDGSGSAARRVFVPAVARHGRGRGAGSGGSGLRCISAATASETLPSDGAHARRRCAQQACELSPGDMPGGGRQSTSVLPLHPQRSDSERQTCARARAGQGCVASTTSASACATCQRRSGGIKRCWDCNTSARPAPRLTCHRARRQLEACSSHHAASTRAHVSTSRRRFAHTTHCAGRFADEPSFGLSPAFMRSDDGAARRPAAALSCFGGWAPELCRNHEHYHWRPELSPHSWVLRGVSWPWAAGGGVAATRGLADADHEP